MWQELRQTYKDQGFELVTVGLDTLGADGCRPFIEAAKPAHPSLIDDHHVLANLYGITNIPQSVWIDEDFRIVRPVESAPPPPDQDVPAPGRDLPDELPQRMAEILTEASKIKVDAAAYHQALEDWVRKGAESQYALSPDEVIERSTPRDFNKALGHAHFELAAELEKMGRHELAVRHFRESHRLVPESWTFRRQAWSLEQVVDGPFARYWQGPDPDDPVSWPYDSDWLSDIRKAGAANYYARWKP